MPFLFLRLLLITFAVPAFVFSGSFSSADTGRTMLPMGLTPVHEKPLSGSLPVSYCEQGDTCRIDSSMVDSTGTAWLFVRSGQKSGWVMRAGMCSPRSHQEVLQTEANTLKNDPDAKRRYRILEQHPEWLRRTARAVREGRICLDMSEQQVIASWGEPSQKGNTFILGAGQQDIWYYAMPDRKVQCVFLVKGRVVGWSEK